MSGSSPSRTTASTLASVDPVHRRTACPGFNPTRSAAVSSSPAFPGLLPIMAAGCHTRTDQILLNITAQQWSLTEAPPRHEGCVCVCVYEGGEGVWGGVSVWAGSVGLLFNLLPSPHNGAFRPDSWLHPPPSPRHCTKQWTDRLPLAADAPPTSL